MRSRWGAHLGGMPHRLKIHGLFGRGMLEISEMLVGDVGAVIVFVSISTRGHKTHSGSSGCMVQCYYNAIALCPNQTFIFFLLCFNGSGDVSCCIYS
mmetsp:Transcript_65657/g.109425  ORF Transcript_65657/g.109425 Transcript_65657/m.109425 type:complete len:97 (+) Transcript_65657:384-674(+)